MASTKASGPGRTPQDAALTEPTTDAPTLPSQPTDSPVVLVPPAPAEAPHFHTPTWVRPEDKPRASVLPHLPAQAAPAEERIVRPDNVPDKGRWVARHRIRTLLCLLVVALVAGTAAAGWYAVTRDRQDLLPYFAFPALLLVGLWALLISSSPMKLELDGAMLTVRHHGRREVFDLADSATTMSVTPAGERPWQVHLECLDGSSIKISERQFKAETLRPVFDHFARITRARMVARLERYRS